MKKRLMIICAILFLSVGFSCKDQFQDVEKQKIEEAESSGNDDDDNDDDITPQQHNTSIK